MHPEHEKAKHFVESKLVLSLENYRTKILQVKKGKPSDVFFTKENTSSRAGRDWKYIKKNNTLFHPSILRFLRNSICVWELSFELPENICPLLIVTLRTICTDTFYINVVKALKGAVSRVFSWINDRVANIFANSRKKFETAQME